MLFLKYTYKNTPNSFSADLFTGVSHTKICNQHIFPRFSSPIQNIFYGFWHDCGAGVDPGPFTSCSAVPGRSGQEAWAQVSSEFSQNAA